MSPEQVRCEPLDRRSDVFCLGILLYELTVGRKPFRADNEYLLHKQIIEDDPPRPTTIDPAYPAELEAIVMRALAKDRRDRQPTALAVQQALTTFASAHRLDVSQFALGTVMSDLFADELAEWHHALRAGESLVDHVIKRTTSTMRILDDGGGSGGATGTGDPQVSAVTQSLAETTPERPSAVPRRRRRWLAPVALALASTGIAATIALWPAADSQRSGAHDPASTAPASERRAEPPPIAPEAEPTPAPAQEKAPTPAPAQEKAPTPTREDAPERAGPQAAPGEPAAVTGPGSRPPAASASPAKPSAKPNAKPRASKRLPPGSAPARPPQDPPPAATPPAPGPDDLL